MNNKQLVLESTKNLIGLKARNVQRGHGSFLTIGFGRDIEYTITIRGILETKNRPEWFLWIYSGNWELHANESGIDLICSSCDEQSAISEKITVLEGKTLYYIEITPSLSYTKFIFDNYILIVYPPEWYQVKDYSEDWMLFTPEKKVLCVQKMHAWIENTKSPKQW